MTENHHSLLPAMSSDRVGATIAKAVEERPDLVIPGLSNRIAARLFRTFPTLGDRLVTFAPWIVPSVTQP